jgi:hypothetical protein
MERNKRAAGLADKPNLFLDPCSSAGLAAISLDRLHPDHTSHRAHNCLVHATQLTLLNSQLLNARLLNSHCSTQEIRCGDYLPDSIAEKAFGNMSLRRADFAFRLDGKLTRKSLPGN